MLSLLPPACRCGRESLKPLLALPASKVNGASYGTACRQATGMGDSIQPCLPASSFGGTDVPNLLAGKQIGRVSTLTCLWRQADLKGTHFGIACRQANLKGSPFGILAGKQTEWCRLRTSLPASSLERRMFRTFLLAAFAACFFEQLVQAVRGGLIQLKFENRSWCYRRHTPTGAAGST